MRDVIRKRKTKPSKRAKRKPAKPTKKKLPRPSTTRSTAGPGFDFEDRVGAWFPDSKNDLCGSTLSLCKCLLSYLGRGLGLRPLTRTTRSVAPTEAGERLLRTVGPRLDEVDAELAALSELRDKPAGTIRITAGEHAAESILWPAVARLLPQYPDIKVEIVVDYGLTNIVAERYDAGVRLGEQVAKGMIAVRIGPDVYLAPRSRSDTKQKILRGYLTASGQR